MAESRDAELGVPRFKLWFLPDWAWRMTSSYLINPSELYFPRLLGERHGGSEVVSRIRERVQRKYSVHPSLPVQLMQLIEQQ